jgi:recombination protein RecR
VLFPKALAELIAELEKLPGVGPKSAQRLAFHLLRQADQDVYRLADALRNAKDRLGFCVTCQNFSEMDRCEICADARRDQTMLCVVAEAKDVAAFERLNEYRGLYHVLHGVMDPMSGVGPEQIRVRELIARLQHSDVAEIIVATNPTIEGEATALYLARLIKPSGIRVTRLAQGMSVGGELDYADSATLLSALEFRREMS